MTWNHTFINIATFRYSILLKTPTRIFLLSPPKGLEKNRWLRLQWDDWKVAVVGHIIVFCPVYRARSNRHTVLSNAFCSDTICFRQTNTYLSLLNTLSTIVSYNVWYLLLAAQIKLYMTDANSLSKTPIDLTGQNVRKPKLSDSSHFCPDNVRGSAVNLSPNSIEARLDLKHELLHSLSLFGCHKGKKTPRTYLIARHLRKKSRDHKQRIWECLG